MGRKSKYTEKLADEICEALVENDRGLENLLKSRDDFPSGDTVWRWKAENPEFSEKITRAQTRLSERLMFDAFADIKVAQAVVSEDPKLTAYATLIGKASDNSMKLAAKVAPREYSEMRRNLHGGDPDLPPIQTESTHGVVDLERLSDEDRNALMKMAHVAIQKGAVKGPVE